jgi:hypothetical protein
MAAATRPAIIIAANRDATYQSLDATDETIYNNLEFKYIKRAFFEAVQTRLQRAAVAGEHTLNS